jgi:hypothetical protein
MTDGAALPCALDSSGISVAPAAALATSTATDEVTVGAAQARGPGPRRRLKSAHGGREPRADTERKLNKAPPTSGHQIQPWEAWI